MIARRGSQKNVHAGHLRACESQAVCRGLLVSTWTIRSDILNLARSMTTTYICMIDHDA